MAQVNIKSMTLNGMTFEPCELGFDGDNNADEPLHLPLHLHTISGSFIIDLDNFDNFPEMQNNEVTITIPTRSFKSKKKRLKKKFAKKYTETYVLPNCTIEYQGEK